MPLLDIVGTEISPDNSNNTGILTGDNQTINLLGGDDFLENITGSGNIVRGDAGNDGLDGTDGTGNSLYGDQGDDTIKGGTNDTVYGGTGRDVIYAGAGNTINLGAGRDVVYIATAEIPAAVNTITDFNAAEDYIAISLAPDLTSIDDLTITAANGNTTISFNGQEIAILNGVAANDLTAITVDNTNTIASGNVAVLPAGESTFPNVPTDVITGFTLDVDGNGVASEATDALLINQYLTTKTFGVTLSDEDIAGLFDPEGTRTTAADISAYLDPFYDELTTGGLDVDGNGVASEATDALLINQYLTTTTFGVTLSDEDIAGLFDPEGTRTTAVDISNYLAGFMPESTPV